MNGAARTEAAVRRRHVAYAVAAAVACAAVAILMRGSHADVAQAQFALLVLVLVQALLLGVPAVVLGTALARRAALGGEPAAFTCSMVVLGAAGEAAFFAARFTPLAASAGLIAEIALVAAACAAAARDAGTRRALRAFAPWTALVLATGVALGYAALLGAATPLGGDVRVAARTAWITLPGDDILPQLLARQAETHAPPRPFAGDWLSSDRPPLQAGLAVVWDAVLPFAPAVRYESGALWLQALAFGGLYVLALALGAGRRRAAVAALLCVPAGFFFINVVFVWPKLFAAAFGLAAIATAWPRGAHLRARYVLAGAAFAIGMLAHAGIAFTLPALLVAAVVRDRRDGLAALVPAAAVFVAIGAPWVAYQRFYDPPGDRLVKWHLAGVTAPQPERSALDVIARAYAATPLGDVVRARIVNLETPFTLRYGDRSGEFFYLLPALGALGIACAAGLIPSRRERGVAALGALAVASLVVWCAMKWGGTVNHEGSYVTIAMLFAVGAMTATRSAWTAAALGAVQTAAFVRVWLWGVVAPALLALEIAVLLAAAVVVAAAAAGTAALRVRRRAEVLERTREADLEGDVRLPTEQ